MILLRRALGGPAPRAVEFRLFEAIAVMSEFRCSVDWVVDRRNVFIMLEFRELVRLVSENEGTVGEGGMDVPSPDVRGESAVMRS